MKTEEQIKQAFDPYFEAPLEAWKAFTDRGETRTFEKNQVLKLAGSPEQYLSFILSGSGGILLWKEHQPVCIDLCYEGEFFGDYMSFLTGEPTPLEVVLFETTSLFRISRTEFDTLTALPGGAGDKICRFASEALFIHKQRQQMDILTKTAAERYHELQILHPDIIRRTPQKFIASYLGITPQSLSRIRKEWIPAQKLP